MEKQTAKKLKMELFAITTEKKCASETSLYPQNNNKISSKPVDGNYKKISTEEKNTIKEVKASKISASGMKPARLNQDIKKPADVISQFDVTELFNASMTVEEENNLTHRILRCDDLGFLKKVLLEARQEFLYETAVQKLTNYIKFEDLKHEVKECKSLATNYREKAKCKETRLQRIEEEITCRICHDIITKVTQILKMFQTFLFKLIKKNDKNLFLGNCDNLWTSLL